MVKLGICDDNKKDMHRIHEMCKEIMSKVKMEYEIAMYDSGYKLLLDISEINLLILDIDMPEINGIDIKNQIQFLNKDIIIIFVTNYNKFMHMAFGIHVYGFIQKKDLKMQLEKILVSAINMMERYVLVNGGLDSRSIRYIKSERVYSDLFMENGERIVTRTPLYEYEQLLMNVDFARIHRTYLVNFMWVDGITNEGAKMGEEIIPISTRLRKKVKTDFLMYCAKNGRYC